MPVLAASADPTTRRPASGAATTSSTNSPDDGPFLAVEVDRAADSPEALTDRLGRPPAYVAVPLDLPLTGTSTVELRTAALEADELGAGLVVAVRPHAGLEDYDQQVADGVALSVTEATADLQAPALVVLGPQMNTPWVAWGLRPTAYTDAFRMTAEALRAIDGDVAMVWSPQAGEGYPFPTDAPTPADGAGDAGTDPALDTNQDGVLDDRDDAYSPYYPGDEWVDMVGLTMLYDPQTEQGVATPVPEPDTARSLLGRAEGVDPDGFYQRYAVDRDLPLLVDTGAAYRPGEGPGETEVKAGWWDQVLRLHAEGYDRTEIVLMHEISYTDAEGRAVDLRVTDRPDLARWFMQTVEEHGVRTGPLVAPNPAAGERTTGTTLDRQSSWIVVGVVLGLVLLLWAAALWVRPMRALAYPATGRRDLRVDLLRGLAILFVVVDHLGMTSLFHLASQEAIGIVSGAELFVVLAGVILGIVSRPRMSVGMFEAVDRGWSRAWRLYLWALFVPLTVFALSHVPWLNTTPVTTYSVPTAGPVAPTSPPSSYDLFAGLEGLLQYPADPSVVPRLLGLQFGPWQFNILGLYVILLFLSPFVLHAFHRGWTAQVLLVSGALYALGQLTGLQVLPFQSDDAFPVLAWQLLFVLGMAAGFFRPELLRFLRSGTGRGLLLLSCLAAAGFMLLSWNNPFLSNAYDVRLSLVDPEVFNPLYNQWFDRTQLRPGRLLNVVVLVVAAFALLTVLWKPIHALLGWLLVPLGRATLYVFIMHVFVIILVTNLRIVPYGDVWLNTLVYGLVILTLLLMVRSKFLFRFVPR
ncbi:OpgC domain-containing protein [Ornithinimicrobium kibberense]|uniref:OpgC domain-containing protein n=1 Tax=Ornithinimicrobium kibberense TaxID=282060 RepID=UPI003A93A5D9